MNICEGKKTLTQRNVKESGEFLHREINNGKIFMRNKDIHTYI